MAEEGLGVLGFGTCDGVGHGGNSFLCKPGVLCDPDNMCISVYPERCICIHVVFLYFKDLTISQCMKNHFDFFVCIISESHKPPNTGLDAPRTPNALE